MENIYNYLEAVNSKPRLYEKYTAEKLWADEHISKKMLEYHLSKQSEAASRNIDFIKESVEFIINEFSLKKGEKLIDFGCGPGLYTSLFNEKGLDVTGVDFSMNSIEFAKVMAKNKKQDIKYIHKNYLEYKSEEKHNIATLIYCDYCPLDKSQRTILLDNIKGSLKEEGYFFFDVFHVNAYSKREDVSSFTKNHMNSFFAKDDYYCFTNSFKYDDDKVFLDKYTVITENKTFEIYNWLKYFEVDELVTEIENAGFAVEKVFCDVKGSNLKNDSETIALKCRKK